MYTHLFMHAYVCMCVNTHSHFVEKHSMVHSTGANDCRVIMRLMRRNAHNAYPTTHTHTHVRTSVFVCALRLSTICWISNGRQRSWQRHDWINKLPVAVAHSRWFRGPPASGLRMRPVTITYVQFYDAEQHKRTSGPKDCFDWVEIMCLNVSKAAHAPTSTRVNVGVCKYISTYLCRHRGIWARFRIIRV